MKRIGITSNPNFPIDEWTKQIFALNKIFETPKDLTQYEIEFALRVMEIFQLESDNDEGLIEFVCIPSDLMSLLVHIKRIHEEFQKQYSDV
jgi:hypothetical protein